MVPESDFERDTMKWMQKEIIEKMHFENDWDKTGKFYIDFDHDWGR